MAKPHLARTKEFLSHDIWYLKLDKYPKWQRWFMKLARIIMLAIKGYDNKNLSLSATALTLYTLLSVVPVVAMIFGIAKGFGLEEYLTKQLQEAFAGQPDILTNLLAYAHNMLSNTKGGLIAGLGFLLLLWSVVQVLSNIENAFNSIWFVKAPRVWSRKFTDYLSIMLVAPLFIILSGSVTIYLSTQIGRLAEQLAFLGGFIQNLIIISIQFLPYLTTSVLFFLVYLVMPNTRVKPRSALVAGIIAGCVFQVFEWAYIEFQVGVSRYNAIYGSFASIPLFITWLQFSWIIVLIGAEISYSVQNVTHFEGMQQTGNISHKMRMLYSIHILRYIALRFKDAHPAPDISELSRKLEIPANLCKNLLDSMIRCRLVSEVYNEKNKEHAFVPALDVSYLTIGFIINKLESLGELKRSAQPEDDALHRIKTFYIALEKAMTDSHDNKNITEI